MQLPHKVATLLYAFDGADRVLLMERAQEPNLGLWSPPGGKLNTGEGESPHACAAREAAEELGVSVPDASALHLTGIITEHGFAGTAHWLMFLFELRTRLSTVPPPMREGRFAFWRREELDRIPLPTTDRERIWPWFWEHRGGFFAAHCHCHADGHFWTLEDSRPGPGPGPGREKT